MYLPYLGMVVLPVIPSNNLTLYMYVPLLVPSYQLDTAHGKF